MSDEHGRRRTNTESPSPEGYGVANGRAEDAAEKRRRLRGFLRNAALVAVSVGLVVGLAVLADRIAPWFYPSATPLGYIDMAFPPGSVEEFATPEFEFTARINSLGIRDEEIPLESEHACRILAFGDSFTYGYGVDLEDTWLKHLERNLREQGVDAETVNMGRSGTGAVFYAAFAERTVPVLRPDVVLVAVLHNDLAQSPLRRAGGRENWLALQVRAWFPNLTRLVRIYAGSDTNEATIVPPPSRHTAEENREQFVHVAHMHAEQWNAAERARFEALDEEVQRLFLDGDLNPFMVGVAVTCPTFYTSILPAEDGLMDYAVEDMARCLGRIRRVAHRYDAQVIVAVVPAGAYVNEHQYEHVQRLGFEVAERMLTSPAPDLITREGSAAAELPCVSVTEDFRQRREEPGLYFPLDNHFSPKGHRLYADLLTPKLLELIAEP